MGWLDGLLGRILSSGVLVPLEGALNFTNGLRATRNTAEGRIDVDVSGIDITDPDVVTTPINYIDPAHPTYGAVGDGTANDKPALLLAITAGIAAGLPVHGCGRTYGVSGNLELVANAWLDHVDLKQLAPGGAGDVRTLTSDGADNIRLVSVTVDRNGDGTNGTINDDAGIYISGGTGHYFEDVEVFGDDMGTGFSVQSASNFDAVRVHVHDMNYNLVSEPADDSVQGLWFNNCTDFRVTAPKAHDLGGDWGAGATFRYSRGIVFSGCNDWTCTDASGKNIDQGLDITGSAGNESWSVIGGVMADCFSAGWKAANTGRDGIFNGCTAERCGQAGFIFSGPASAGLTKFTGEITVIGCQANDTGIDFWLASQDVAGFRIVNSDFDPTTCKNIHFIGCRAYDRRGGGAKMEYGFHNANTGENAAVDCHSIGHTVSEFGGTWKRLGSLDAELSAIAGLTSAADKLPYFTGSGTAALADLSAAARTVLDDASVGAMLTTLGGQPLDAELTALASVTSAADKVPYFTGSGTASTATLTSAGRAQIASGAITDDGNSSTADTIDFSTNLHHKSTMTGACTYTFTAPAAAGVIVTLRLVQDATGGRVATFPGTVIGAPVYDTTATTGDTTLAFLYDGANYLLLHTPTRLQSSRTIAAGVVSVSRATTLLVIDTESAAATDDLDTINGGAIGQVITVISTNNARDPTLKDGTGNLRLAADRLLDTVQDTCTLIWDGSAWLEISFANNA